MGKKQFFNDFISDDEPLGNYPRLKGEGGGVKKMIRRFRTLMNLRTCRKAYLKNPLHLAEDVPRGPGQRRRRIRITIRGSVLISLMTLTGRLDCMRAIPVWTVFL